MGNLDRVFHVSTQIQLLKLSYTLANHLHTNTVDDHHPPPPSDHSHHVLSPNKLLSCHVDNGRLQHAQKLFDEMPTRDVVSWNTMLLGFRKAKDPRGVYHCFLRMLRAGFSPTGHTISLLLTAVLGPHSNVLVPQLHVLALRSALAGGLFVGSALMRGYADVGDPLALKKVFDDVRDKDVSSWNALVSGYMRLGLVIEARRAFDAMPETNVVSWTSLIHGYISANQISEARYLFDKTSEKNVVCWTAMIGGYVQSRGFRDALELFLLMTRSGVRPNGFTFSRVVVACAGLNSLLVGRQVHSSISKHGAPSDVVLSSSLVDMYAKCGDIEAASRVFEAIPDKNVVAWNSIIGGYARHGLAVRALEEFERMERSGAGPPDHVTFVNVLSGCAHGGLVAEGEKLFYSMVEKHRIRAGPEHYACMVDLYGRSGAVDKATNFVKEMPIEPDVIVWGTLLAGSRSVRGSKTIENRDSIQKIN